MRMASRYHLAQLNIARMVAPLDSPLMAEFVAALDSVNRAAELSPGFVWRLTNATSVQPYGPGVLVNMSIWETVEALKAFTYTGSHVQVFRKRAEWFHPHERPYMVMWWVPAGHVPGMEEAMERLELRRRQGDTAEAFSFAGVFPPPQAAAGTPA